MLQNLKDIYGHKLAASDGEIGRVKDFYFDDITWAVRYLVADTGTWLTDRQVLLSPHAFGRFEQDTKILHITLTRDKIKDCPPIHTHRPVSRQNEEEYFGYYGLSPYWDGAAAFGASTLTTIRPPPTANKLRHGHNQRDDVHLRSTQAVTGYAIEASDGTIGSVSGFMVDHKTWFIRELVVETGHWYAGKEILITPAKVDRIGYAESKVFVQLTKADIEKTGEHMVVKAGSSSHGLAAGPKE